MNGCWSPLFDVPTKTELMLVTQHHIFEFKEFRTTNSSRRVHVVRVKYAAVVRSIKQTLSDCKEMETTESSTTFFYKLFALRLTSMYKKKVKKEKKKVLQFRLKQANLTPSQLIYLDFTEVELYSSQQVTCQIIYFIVTSTNY